MFLPFTNSQPSQKKDPTHQPLVVRVFLFIAKKWKVIVFTIAFIFGITQTAGFTSFILEEKQQQLGFGVFSYLQAKQWRQAKDSIMWCLKDAKRDMWAYKILNVFNPITGWAFVDYGEANIRKLQWQLDSVQRRLGEVEEAVAALEKKIDKPTTKVMASIPLIQVQAQPAPTATRNGFLRPVRQIDYKTQAERINEVTESVHEWVYVTPNGKKYHRRGCRFAKRPGVRRVGIKQAIGESYTACSICGKGR